MTTPPHQPVNLDNYLDLCHFQARCKVVRKLGIGAFAAVYEVVFDKQPAALKILLPSQHTKKGIAKFKKEAAVLRDCRHRNIVRCMSLLQVPPGVRGISGSSARLAMLLELVKGESALSMLTKQLQVPSRRLYTQHQAVKWCRDVGAALLYLHNNGIIHRDVKPANVLLCHSSSNGVAAKLTDFGVHHQDISLQALGVQRISVQILEVQDISMQCSMVTDDSSLAAPEPACWVSSVEADKSAQRVMSQLTGCTGTCMYMAPEVYLCQPYNEKADVFSFGVMMYEILGRTLNLLLLTHADLDTKTYCKRVCEGFRPSQPSRLPPALWSLITSCWDAEPCNRPDMDWVVEQLDAWLDQENKALMEQDAPKCYGCTVL